MSLGKEVNMHFVSLRVGLALAMALSTVIADLDRPGDEEYIIWPVDPINPEAVRFITKALAEKAGGPAEVYTSTVTRRPSPLYWLARLPAKEVGAIRSISGVTCDRTADQRMIVDEIVPG